MIFWISSLKKPPTTPSTIPIRSLSWNGMSICSTPFPKSLISTVSGNPSTTYFSVLCNSYNSVISKASSTDIYCNMLKASDNTEINTLRIGTSTGNILLIFPSDFAEYTLEAVRAKVQQLYDNGTPIIIEIPLAEEEIIPYTSTQKSQYNAIKQSFSYLDETNISVTGSDLEPVVDATAIRSLNDILTRLEVLESEV